MPPPPGAGEEDRRALPADSGSASARRLLAAADRPATATAGAAAAAGEEAPAGRRMSYGEAALMSGVSLLVLLVSGTAVRTLSTATVGQRTKAAEAAGAVPAK